MKLDKRNYEKKDHHHFWSQLNSTKMRQTGGGKECEKPFLTSSTTHGLADGWDGGSSKAPGSLQPECTCKRPSCVPKSVRGYEDTKRVGRPEEFWFQAKTPQNMRNLKPEANNVDCWLQWVVSSYLLKKSDGTSHATKVTRERSLLLGHSMTVTQNEPNNTV